MNTRFQVSRRLAALVTALLWLGSSGHLLAQDQSTVSLTVTIAGSGEPTGLAEVQSLDETGIVRSASIDRTHRGEVRGLAPGRYRVTVSRAQFKAAVLDVSTDPGDQLALIATLEPASGSANSTLRLDDRYHAGEAVVIRQPHLDGLPSSPNLWSLIDALVPWTLVDVIDGGGVETGRRGLFGSRDGSWTWNTFVMDGIDLTDPARPGTPLQYPDAKTLQTVTLTSTQAPADVSAPGAQVTLVPRRASRSRHASVEVAGTSPGMVSNRRLDIAPNITDLESWHDANAQFSTPLGPTTGLFAAVRATGASFLERDQQPARDASVRSAMAHLVLRPTNSDEVRVVASVQRTRRPLEGGDTFLGRTVDEDDTFTHAQAHWDRIGDTGIVTSLALGLQRGSFSPDVDNAASLPGGVVDRVYDGAVPTPLAHRVSRRLDVRADLRLPGIAVGRSWHAWSFGGQVTAARATSDILAAPPVAETVGRVPARLWTFDVPATNADRRIRQLSAWMADDMRIGDHLLLNAGVRLDHWHGKAQGAAAGIGTLTFSPRLAARSNFPGFFSAIYGSIARYSAPLPLGSLAFGDPAEPTARLYRWTDPNGDGAFTADERGPQLALAGWGAPIGSIDPNLRLPRTYEFVLGGELRLGTALFRSTATIRHQYSLARAVPTGIPLSSYTKTMIPDQTELLLELPLYNRPPGQENADRYTLTNPENDHLLYHALEFVYEQPISPNFRMRASALEWWSFGPGAAPGFKVLENDQGLLGELFQDPNTVTHANGANFFDRSYVLKWSGSYLAPRDFWLSFTANYRDGQGFAGLIVVPDLVQGPEIIQAYRRGRTRFTFTVLWDARIEKRFTVGGRQAGVWLDLFNIPGLDEEVEENPILGVSDHRISTAMQPPRVARIGFRIGF